MIKCAYFCQKLKHEKNKFNYSRIFKNLPHIFDFVCLDKIYDKKPMGFCSHFRSLHNSNISYSSVFKKKEKDQIGYENKRKRGCRKHVFVNEF